ncbi:MAG TPA: AraC family transcriptional regulator [Candidatus Angelobacter sp.]|nr:AraC family transcriptional regulator [Candidatus Angelobacter sp.]
MAKIAVELAGAVAQRQKAGFPGRTMPRLLAAGPGWTVQDVICTCGPGDRPFEESHSGFSVAIVAAGTFQYKSSAGGGRSRRELMTPGAILLGSPGQCFECGHEHGYGDRCISFWFDSPYFSHITGVDTHFNTLGLPPLKDFSAVVAAALASYSDPANAEWEALGVKLAGKAAQLSARLEHRHDELLPSAESRITRALRRVDGDLHSPLSLRDLAAEARLSPYHFLRLFEKVTGLTPHQFVRRARLRKAATRLLESRETVLEIALDSGFADVSNFNRAFRGEFGCNPRLFRSLRQR